MRRGYQPVARRGGEHLGEQLLALEIDARRQPAEMVGGDLRPDRAVELVAGVAEQDQRLPRFGAQPGRDAPVDVVDHAEHADDRRREDRRGAGLVVEADVAAGDRNAKRRTAVGETADRLTELPHHRRVLRRAEVEAVGHRDRRRAGDGDVAVRLGQRELRAGVRVELGVAAGRVGGYRDAAAGGFVDAQHAAVGMFGEHGVTADVAVVLLGDERAAAQVRTAKQRKQSRLQFVAGDRPRQLGGGVGVERVLGVRTLHETLVDRSLVGDRARRHIDDRFTVPRDLQPVAVGHLPDDGGQHFPLAAHRHELLDVLRCNNRAHAFLRLAGQDLGGRHVGRPQRHGVQFNPHATVAGRCEFGCRTGQSGATEVLDADHQVVGVQLQAALDEHLFREGVADLDAWQLLARSACRIELRSSPGSFFLAAERFRCQHRHASDAVEAGARTEEDDLVACARREREVQVLLAQHPDAQRVHQRVAGVGRVEDGLAADVGQSQRVSVAADAAHHSVHHPACVRRVGGAEPQLVHDGHRAGTHRHDVADDATDSGGRALVGLDVRRVVVRLNLEGGRPAVADVDDARVLADARQHRSPHRLGGGLTEVAQVHLGGLVGAVLAPHHRVHGQLGIRGPTAEDLAYPLVLVVLQAEFTERLRLLGSGGGVVNSVKGVGELRRHAASLVWRASAGVSRREKGC